MRVVKEITIKVEKAEEEEEKKKRLIINLIELAKKSAPNNRRLTNIHRSKQNLNNGRN